MANNSIGWPESNLQEIETLKQQLTSARSRIEELEGALREIMLKTQYVGKLAQPLVLAKVYHTAHQALSGKSENEKENNVFSNGLPKRVWTGGEPVEPEPMTPCKYHGYEVCDCAQPPDEPVELKEVTREELAKEILDIGMKALYHRANSMPSDFMANALLTKYTIKEKG